MFNIEILGINSFQADIDLYNQAISNGNPLPWLQDTSSNHVWSTWAVTYRDLRILDSSNRLVGVLNLTANDLGNSENYQTAKQMFLAAANSGDVDRNGFPDQWETKYFSETGVDKDDDPDHDGYSNYLEFALGTDPLDPSSHPELPTSFNGSDQFTVSLTRWGGSQLDYFVQASTHLVSWSASTVLIRNSVTNLFDGTGRFKITCNFSKSRATQPAGFIRTRIQSRP